MFMPISDTHFLKVSAHASLKVAIKSSFRGKKRQKFRIFKAIFLKQKQSTATKKFGISLRNLVLLLLVQRAAYLGEVGACFSFKGPTKASFRSKNTPKI